MTAEKTTRARHTGTQEGSSPRQAPDPADRDKQLKTSAGRQSGGHTSGDGRPDWRQTATSAPARYTRPCSRWSVRS